MKYCTWFAINKRGLENINYDNINHDNINHENINHDTINHDTIIHDNINNDNINHGNINPDTINYDDLNLDNLYLDNPNHDNIQHDNSILDTIFRLQQTSTHSDWFQIEDALKADGETLVNKVKGVFAFKVKDANGNEGVWIVDAKNGKGSVEFFL